MGTPVKAILLDFNNTISPANFLASFEQHAAELSMPPADMVQLYLENGLLKSVMLGKITEEQFWKHLSSITGTPLGVLMKVAETIRESRRLDPEVMCLVHRLKKAYRLALLTDNVGQTFDFWVEKYRLWDYFDVIVNSAEHGLLKGDRRIYSLCLQELECKPEEAVLVDDSPSNIKLAQDLGLKTILFENAKQLFDELNVLGLMASTASENFGQDNDPL